MTPTSKASKPSAPATTTSASRAGQRSPRPDPIARCRSSAPSTTTASPLTQTRASTSKAPTPRWSAGCRHHGHRCHSSQPSRGSRRSRASTRSQSRARAGASKRWRDCTNHWRCWAARNVKNSKACICGASIHRRRPSPTALLASSFAMWRRTRRVNAPHRQPSSGTTRRFQKDRIITCGHARRCVQRCRSPPLDAGCAARGRPRRR